MAHQEEEKSKAPGSSSKVGKSSHLINVGEVRSYADALGKLRKELDPDLSGDTVVRARATAKGDILIQFGDRSNKKAIVKKVEQVIEKIR